MSDGSSFKRIPISKLHEFDPKVDTDSYFLVCNYASSSTTGIVDGYGLISNYLDNVMSGSDDFSGLNNYLSNHGGGGGGGNLPEMIEGLYSRHEPVDILEDELVVYHSTSSTFRIEINDMLLGYLDAAHVDAGNSWQSVVHWLYYTYQDNMGDTSHLYKVLSNEYLDYQMYHYFDDLEELDPAKYSAELKMPIYGVEDEEEDEDTLHYISLGELAEYIQNYTPPV